MSDGEIVQKQGEIIAVLPQKSGFTEIQIQEEGRQYPYKASTKLPDIIEAANAGLFQQAVLTAKEVDSGNPNPHKPGTNYINRTAMKVEVGGTMTAQPTSGPSRNASGSGGAKSPDERGSIERQTIVKAAISLYPEGLVKTDADFFALLGRLEAFCAGKFAAAAPEGMADPDDLPF